MDQKEIEVILAARRTIIDYDKKYWNRNNRPDEWDITIGAKDSAELTDLVGVYLLHVLGLELLEVGRACTETIFL